MYFVVYDWMVNELNLKGAERDVYAIVYGFSQDGESEFHGSLQYIANMTGYSRNSVCNALNSLVEKGLLLKEQSDKNNIKCCRYRTSNLDTVQATCTPPVQATWMNNISNKKTINKTISKDIVQNFVDEESQPKTKKKNQYQKCMDMIDEYTTNSELRELLAKCYKLFSENNRETGRPFYANTFKGKLNILSGLATDSATQIKIVQQTLDNGWNGFYELHDNKRKTRDFARDVEHLTGGMNQRADKENMKYGQKF